MMSKRLIYLVSFVFVPFIGLSQHVQAGLVGYWKLDESSGTIAADTAEGNIDGTLYGDLEWRPGEGKAGGALFFSSDDNTARVEIPTTGMSASEGTMMIWCKLAGPYPTDRIDASYFFGHTTRPPYANRIQLYMDNNDTILDLGLGDSHTRRTGIKRLQTRIWYHIALTWDSGRYVVYVDGEKITAGSYTGLTILHKFMDIGNDGNPSQGTEAFAGLLDEVRLYDHALTADEIRTAMDSEVSLQASWPSPSDGASHPKTWVTLSWMAGDSAVSHDVYFGDHIDHVNTGTDDTFQGNQTSTEYVAGLPGSAHPDGLVPNTTYYWRIDEVEADGVTKHRGTVWSFFVPFVEVEPSAVPTFHCIGVYWSPQDGHSDNICQVHYRSVGSTDWKEALPLWYDDRGVGGYPAGYRGSIVNLDPGTTYEIELSLYHTGTTEIFTARTWSADFPIAQTVYLPAGTTHRPLEITESGSPDGYILYTHPEGRSSTIDVSNQEDSCIYVSASYIIIRGLTLRDASIHGIRILNNVHDVVIEECDISGWGRLQEGEWGYNNDAAVFSNSSNIERIIIQRNKLHHPRSDTNSHLEPARTIPSSPHLLGPQAIVLKPRNERAGNYVIRYNEIYSDEDHYYNDCMGETYNFSYHGFPIRDTDIYGNYVANCWGTGIEAEGANCNVRIWGNYITRTAHKISTQSVSVGPLYIWRNVCGISRVGPNDYYGWRAFKAGNVHGWGGGKTYIFHNTILQPPPPDQGSSGGVNAQDANLTHTTTRNNILHISNERYDSICDPHRNATNDFDYDLFNGNIVAYRGAEPHGIKGVPIYDRHNGEGEFALDPSSPGYDAGVVIPNFNDHYYGIAPDIGAHEAGNPPMEFGVDAYQ